MGGYSPPTVNKGNLRFRGFCFNLGALGSAGIGCASTVGCTAALQLRCGCRYLGRINGRMYPSPACKKPPPMAAPGRIRGRCCSVVTVLHLVIVSNECLTFPRYSGVTFPAVRRYSDEFLGVNTPKYHVFRINASICYSFYTNGVQEASSSNLDTRTKETLTFERKSAFF